MSIGELTTNVEGTDPRLAAAHGVVAEFTRRLFPGEVSIALESDPETPCEYFVVSAVAPANVPAAVELHHRWHAEIGDVVPDAADRYRLSLRMP